MWCQVNANALKKTSQQRKLSVVFLHLEVQKDEKWLTIGNRSPTRFFGPLMVLELDFGLRAKGGFVASVAIFAICIQIKLSECR